MLMNSRFSYLGKNTNGLQPVVQELDADTTAHTMPIKKKKKKKGSKMRLKGGR